MGPVLDEEVVERLVAGDPALPPAYRGLSAVLRAAKAPATPAELESEPVILAAFRAHAARAAAPGRPRPGPIAMGVIVAAISVGGGVAAAAAQGVLPARAQHALSEALHSVGITVPDRSEPAHGGPHTTTPPTTLNRQGRAPAPQRGEPPADGPTVRSSVPAHRGTPQRPATTATPTSAPAAAPAGGPPTSQRQPSQRSQPLPSQPVPPQPPPTGRGAAAGSGPPSSATAPPATAPPTPAAPNPRSGIDTAALPLVAPAPASTTAVRPLPAVEPAQTAVAAPTAAAVRTPLRPSGSAGSAASDGSTPAR